MCMTVAGTIHPFEARGLGIAPFRFVGFYESRGPIMMADGMTQIGAPGQPMGTCDYCGIGIADCYRIKSSDGKEFVVGCDCVAKLSRENNSKSDPLIDAVRKEANKIKTARRHARENAKINAGKLLIDANHDRLASITHPVKSRAERGESFLDQVLWYMNNAGNKGKLEMIALVEKVLAK